MSCNGPHVPQFFLFKTNPNQRMAFLMDDAKLSSDIATKSLPNMSNNLNIPVIGGKYQAKVTLHLPPDFSESKRFPLVIHVYQEVIEEFKLDWGTYLTTREGFIYSLIDERGSGFKVRVEQEKLKYQLRVPRVTICCRRSNITWG